MTSERVQQALRIARLTKALQKIANLPLRDDLPHFKNKAPARIQARRIAVAALKR